MKVALDSSLIVALLMDGDMWHAAFTDLLAAIETAGCRAVCYDVVVTESIRPIPPGRITWA